MEINSKIHVEQPAPHGVHHQHSAKRDGQTKKTKRFSPPRRRVKSKPHQTWHGDKGPQARCCTSKNFWYPTHSFAAMGC